MAGRGHKSPEREAALAAGLKRYFTGIPCKSGHVCERTTSCHKCVECDAIRQKARRDNDPEFRKAASARHHKWREENKDAALKNSAEWYANNRERSLELCAAWQRNNKAAVNATNSKWRKANPKACCVQAKVRAKRVRSATPPWVNMEAIRAVYAACPPSMQVDHIVPIKGKNVCGLHVAWNLSYLTISENSSKGNRWPWPGADGVAPTDFRL